ncbi:sarcosine oxidase subunit alpha, partial [Rhizobium leguminosarum]
SALTAGRAGTRVILADEESELGGSSLSDSGTVEGKPAGALLGELLAELASRENVRRLPRMTVFGWYDDKVFGAVERGQKHVAMPDPERPVERLWRIVARQAILATCAEDERPLFGAGRK